ncbi:transposase [Lysobacter enzymogenes]|nr:transposase [Lysobacter enzymogenes]
MEHDPTPRDDAATAAANAQRRAIALDDGEWEAFKRALGEPALVRAGSERDDRRFVDAALSVMTGHCYWTDLPAQDYGNWVSNYRRNRRWMARGVLRALRSGACRRPGRSASPSTRSARTRSGRVAARASASACSGRNERTGVNARAGDREAAARRAARREACKPKSGGTGSAMDAKMRADAPASCNSATANGRCWNRWCARSSPWRIRAGPIRAASSMRRCR